MHSLVIAGWKQSAINIIAQKDENIQQAGFPDGHPL